MYMQTMRKGPHTCQLTAICCRWNSPLPSHTRKQWRTPLAASCQLLADDALVPQVTQDLGC
jgi:hypothetical protein